jgi:uncharacterized protein YjiK
MAIAFAYIEKRRLWVKDERSRPVFNKCVNEDSQVIGFTSTTVTIRERNRIFVLDDRGRAISNKQV